MDLPIDFDGTYNENLENEDSEQLNPEEWDPW